MKAIWKWPLAVTDEQAISCPRDFQELAVQVQNGVPCLWAVVNVDAPTVERQVKIIGTGHTKKHIETGEYVGTFQLRGGELVFHVFVEEAT